jgi:hypothetical protein
VIRFYAMGVSISCSMPPRVAAFMIILLTAVGCGALPSKTVVGHPAGTSRSQAAAPQPALPKMEGSYKVVAGLPGTLPVTWVFTPCGDGCADVEMGEEGSSQRGTARYVNFQWTIDVHTTGALQCGDGTHVPGTAHYSWNPDTLEGRYWSTADSSRPCGYEPSLDTYPVPLTLKKAGA